MNSRWMAVIIILTLSSSIGAHSSKRRSRISDEVDGICQTEIVKSCGYKCQEFEVKPSKLSFISSMDFYKAYPYVAFR